MHVDVFHRHFLLTAGAISLQGLDLGGERAGQLVEGPFGAVLLLDGLDVRKAASEHHRRVVNCCHLGSEHGLDLIARLDAADN